MHCKGFFAASSAFFAFAIAVPMLQHEHHRRDLVWITSTEEAVVTVPVTTTIWVEPGQTAPVEPILQHPESPFVETTQAAPLAPTFGPGLFTSNPPISVSQDTGLPKPATISTPSTLSPALATATSSSAFSAPTTTSSIYLASIPSSTYVAPATSLPYETLSSTSTYAEPTTSSQSTAPISSVASRTTQSYMSAPTSSGGASNNPAAPGTTYQGDLTNYTPGLGACGWTNGEADKIVAVSHDIFAAYDDNASNGNYVCGKTITINGVNGNPYKATVTDKCMGCDESALDLPLAFFNTVTNNGNGRVHNITWTWDD